MKKTEIKNAVAQLRKCANALEAGNASNAVSAIRALIDELESSEETVGIDVVVAKITEAIEKFKTETEGKTAETVAAEVANQIAQRMKNISNSVKVEVSDEVKHKVCRAIMNSTDKNMRENVEKVLVENGITGLTFNDVIDYTIVENWGNLNPMFSKLKEVPFTKFFYSAQTLANKAILAHQWSKTSETAKAIQALTVSGKQITTDYIYKRQQFAMSDLDDIRESMGETTFINWINEELLRQIINTICMHILIGDTTNDAGMRITVFESIGAKSETDLFTTVLNPATAKVGITDLRTLVDSIVNPNGDAITLVIGRQVLTQISEFIYGEGGSTIYHDTTKLKGMLGVDDIIVSDLLSTNTISGGASTEGEGSVYAVAFIGNEYWYKKKNTIEVAYPTYEHNVVNYQKELNIGGKIHGLKSTAVLKKAED